MENNVIIKINLDNVEQSASQPQLKKLLGENWRIVATVPVDDGGSPTLIVIMAPPLDSIKVHFPIFPIFTDMIVMILLFSIFLTLLFSGGASV